MHYRDIYLGDLCILILKKQHPVQDNFSIEQPVSQSKLDKICSLPEEESKKVHEVYIWIQYYSEQGRKCANNKLEISLDLLESPHKRLSLSGHGNIDLLAKEIINAYASVEVRVTPKGHVYADFREETPLFPADSIFSVFAVEPFRQVTVGIDQDFMNFLGVQSWYARQFFDSDPIDKYSVGFTIERQRETLMALRLERLDDVDAHYWRVYSHLGKRLW